MKTRLINEMMKDIKRKGTGNGKPTSYSFNTDFARFASSSKFLSIYLFIMLIGSALMTSCHKNIDFEERIPNNFPLPSEETDFDNYVFDIYEVQENIYMKDYFRFMDSLVNQYQFYLPELTEHLLVQANDWMIYALECTDYYKKMDAGEFVYDQGDLILIEKGEILLIPNEIWLSQLAEEAKQVLIEVNVPEYKLRVYRDTELLNTIDVRVGRNETIFLATADRLEDLRTKVGSGYIHEIDKDPVYINPVDGHEYSSTLRDDNQRTLLPQIPFLHPKVNGLLYGQLIHPTTNRNTLGKAYSNGCIGLSEGDMWYLYYYAPVGTAIDIKYDLDIITLTGKSIRLPDIYQDSLHHVVEGVL